MIRAVVIAAARFYREGLAQALVRSPDIAVVGTGADAAGAAGAIAANLPDVVLVDLAGSAGLDVVRAVSQLGHGPRIVALGIEETSEHVVACAEAGATAYVPRDASLEELVLAVASAARGEQRCTPRVAAALLRHIGARTVRPADDAGRRAALRLTVREREIVQLIERGLSNKEIASALGIEVATAKNHVHNILEKLGARRRAEAGPRMRGLVPADHARREAPVRI